MRSSVARRRAVFFTALAFAGAAAAQTPAPGFEDHVVFSGLSEPTAVRFAPDGRVFVIEKGGAVKAFSGLGDTTSDLVVDLDANVSSYHDRGLLGLAVDPDFPASPYLYVLYTYDAPPGGTAPTWGDNCTVPPGGLADGCVVSGRLSRLEVDGDNQLVGGEHVLLADNWCQQFKSHSIGTLEFGTDGALYVSGGEGASYQQADYGQFGGSLPNTPTPANPCDDPPVPVGGVQILPTAQGGALRSQDLRADGDPVSFAGTVLRIDPATGEALPDNPLFGGAIADDDRIIAYGLRNPYRMTFDPLRGALWIGDVGWSLWEEVNRIADPTDAVVENFGWPCYEGNGKQAIYDGLNLLLCETLYLTPGAATVPYFTYRHGQAPDAAQCGTSASSAVTGVAVYTGGGYPDTFDGALVFADMNRQCIWAMLAPPGGDPAPANLVTLVAQAPFPVALERGPGGDVFYVDVAGGTIHRLSFPDPAQVFSDGFESGDVAAWSSAIPAL